MTSLCSPGDSQKRHLSSLPAPALARGSWPVPQAAPDRDDQEKKMRKAVIGLFMALAAVLAVVPLAGDDQTETVACCGHTPMGAHR
jgi:hypothetical protein